MPAYQLFQTKCFSKRVRENNIKPNMAEKDGKIMGIGKVIGKVFSYAAKSGKNAAKMEKGVKNIMHSSTPSIFTKVETNTAGRIARMQDAKQAFTPYATKVTKESKPTLQVIEEITGVQRGNVKDATGYFDKQRAADALAAFKYAPVKPTPQYVGNAYTSSVPTQKAIDDMLGIAADTPQARLELLKRRNAVRDTFNGVKRVFEPKVKDINLSKVNITKENPDIKALKSFAENLKKTKKFTNLDEYWAQLAKDTNFMKDWNKYIS